KSRIEEIRRGKPTTIVTLNFNKKLRHIRNRIASIQSDVAFKLKVNTAGMHANVASGIMTVALCVFMLVQPLFGALSDKIGRRTSM
ncbi:hypothetical protein MJI20_27780, partial [Salmonella enterica subsp. enterica serovar Anatum]|nr:hypothetical protein [Salmonella enterica subsp. enterica serovar Anatum]